VGGIAKKCALFFRNAMTRNRLAWPTYKLIAALEANRDRRETNAQDSYSNLACRGAPRADDGVVEFPAGVGPYVAENQYVLII
jgi:hypothetical protein